MGRRRTRKQQGEKKDHLSKGANWATIIGLPIAAAALFLAFLALDGGQESGSKGFSGSPRLKRIDLIARNGPDDPAGLELLVQNRGKGRSVISQAEIEILRVLPIPLCFTQGGLGVSERYGVQLPPDATPGETVELPLHQQVAPNRADRFRIDLGVGEAEEGEEFDGYYLFEVAVAIAHDGKEEPLDMGTAFLSLPDVPLGTEFLLEEGDFPKIVESFSLPGSSLEVWGPALTCWRNNARKAALARKSEATRSTELDEALTSVVAPSYSELGS